MPRSLHPSPSSLRAPVPSCLGLRESVWVVLGGQHGGGPPDNRHSLSPASCPPDRHHGRFTRGTAPIRPPWLAPLAPYVILDERRENGGLSHSLRISIGPAVTFPSGLFRTEHFTQVHPSRESMAASPRVGRDRHRLSEQPGFHDRGRARSDAGGPYLGGEAWSPEPGGVERFWSAEKANVQSGFSGQRGRKAKRPQRVNRARSKECATGRENEGWSRSVPP